MCRICLWVNRDVTAPVSPGCVSNFQSRIETSVRFLFSHTATDFLTQIY